MSNKQEMQIAKIEEMNNLLKSFRAKKREIMPSAKDFEEYKADNYNKLINWLNEFSKKLSFEIIVTFRKDVPSAKVRFYQKAKETDDTTTKKETAVQTENETAVQTENETVGTFEIIVGAPDKIKTYDYYDLINRCFAEYTRNDNKVPAGNYYDSILNIVSSIADEAQAIKTIILDSVEKELYRQINEEDKELSDCIRQMNRY